MYRIISLLLLSVCWSGAQTPSSSPASNLDKPPQDVDDALRARIKTFYDYHVAQKFRMAEQLIAEESKDDFYVMSKPEIKAFKIGTIAYSEDFTKAKVVIVGSMTVLLPTVGGKIMDMPFASYWKIENGFWCWYFNKEASRHTPFGEVKPQDPNAPPNAPIAAATATGLPAMPSISLSALQSAVKIDRAVIELSSEKPETIRVANTLPGRVTLVIDNARMPLAQSGIRAVFDKKDLKGNETAVLTLSADSNMRVGMEEHLRITVSPTNQVLDLTIKIVK